MFSGILGVCGFMMRKKIHETAKFMELKVHHKVTHQPLKKLFKSNCLITFGTKSYFPMPCIIKNLHPPLFNPLTRWGRLAIEQAVWPFAMGGHFYPYRGAPLDPDGHWLEVDVFGVFLRWLAARRDAPRGGDVIGTYESGPDHFLRGLAKFRWPME